MRFLELDLVAYGPFTGTRLDLDAGGPALHLIYGSNEAGKSSMLRAVFGLLYGIDHATTDAYVHAMSALRIGARLSDRSGRALRVLRRKGLKHTLLDAEEQPLSDGALLPFLHGIAEPVYRASFGLDHQSLRAGAEALLAGKGDLGESLFQAGLGLPGVQQVLLDLDSEASKLFKPRGSKQRINDAIAEYKAAVRRSRDEVFSAESWQEARRALDDAQAQRAVLDQRLEALRRDKSRLDRVRQVASRVTERERLLQQSTQFDGVVVLALDATARRRAAQAEQDAAQRALARVGAERARLHERRVAIEVPESLLSVGDDTIRELRNLVGKDEAARRDRPKREAELREFERQAKAALRRLGRRAGKDQIATAALESGLAARIQSLASDKSGLGAGLDHAEQEQERCRAQLARVQQRIAELQQGAPHDVPIPSREQIQSFERELQALEARAERQQEQVREHATLEERNRVDLDALQGEGDVPSEAQLAVSREQRDAQFSALAQVLQHEPVDRQEAQAHLSEGLTQSAGVDALSDRLRREVGRSSQHARLVAERASLVRTHERLMHEGSSIAEARNAWQQRWQALWAPLGQDAGAPSEMLAWWLNHEHCVQARAQLEMQQQQAEDALDTAEVAAAAARRQMLAWKAEWSEEVARLELGPDTSVEEAHAALEELNQLGQLKLAIERMQGRIDGIDRDRERFELEVTRLSDRHLFSLGDAAIEERAEQLVYRHEAAKLAVQQCAELDRELERIDKELSAEQVRLDAAVAGLAALMQMATVDSLAELERAEQRSEALRAIQVRLSELEQQLLDEGAGAGLDELARQAREVDPDSLPHRLALLEEELTELIAQKEALAGRIATHELAMRSHDNRQAAADAASDAAQQLAAIREHTARYVRLWLAARVLEREIARYRDAHQGPILALADRFFVRLTLGRYKKLEAGFDNRDEPELHCVDVHDRKVPITSLSDGTRDALYLALRLASLLRHGERDELMPLVLDDVLIHFDDERAAAALEVLGEVSRHTQVLFFTHHARLRDLARASVEPAQLREHELPSAASRDAATARG